MFHSPTRAAQTTVVVLISVFATRPTTHAPVLRESYCPLIDDPASPERESFSSTPPGMELFGGSPWTPLTCCRSRYSFLSIGLRYSSTIIMRRTSSISPI